MQHRSTLLSLFAMASAFGCASSGDLASEATFAESEATKVALSKVEGGSVKQHELERENGRLIYSFDIVSKDSSITEVQVDAKTGEIVSIEKETAAHEAEEEREAK